MAIRQSVTPLFAFLFLASTAYAEEQVCAGCMHAVAPLAQTNCQVSLRVVKGVERFPGERVRRLHSGEMLKDLREQLEPLPFRRYSLLEAKTASVVLHQEGQFKVKDLQGAEHEVNITPLEFKDGQVSLMVDWSGPDREELLSSKLQVESGKNIVVGTDNEGNQSTILCVKVDCR